MELLSKVLNDVNQIGTANSVLFVYHSHPVHKARVVVEWIESQYFLSKLATKHWGCYAVRETVA